MMMLENDLDHETGLLASNASQLTLPQPLKMFGIMVFITTMERLTP